MKGEKTGGALVKIRKKDKIRLFFKVGRNVFSFPYVKVRYICLHYILKVEIWLQGYGMKDYCPPILLKDVSGGKKNKDTSSTNFILTFVIIE